MVYQYDDYGRIVKSTFPDGTFLRYGYNGIITTAYSGVIEAVTETVLRTTVSKQNAYGLPEYEIDSEADKVVFVYDPRANLVSTHLEGKDTQKNGLLSSILGDGYTKTFNYDDLCRVNTAVETYPDFDEIYTKTFEFDDFGRLSKEHFSGYNVAMENRYHDETGALVETGFSRNGMFTSTWKATGEDELGNISAWNTGNNTISVIKDVNLQSGNINSIDYKYGSNSMYKIDYTYYNDRNFASRKHTVNGYSQSQFYAFDKMNQLIYHGPYKSVAE